MLLFTTPMSTSRIYELVKYFSDSRPAEIQPRAKLLTLEEAQDACNAPSTRKAGEWFIGYRVAGPIEPDSPRHGTASITKALLACHNGLGGGRARHGQWD